MEQNRLARRIAVASGREPADTVIKNGKVIDVFNGEVFEADIAIVDGYIAGIGNYEGEHVVDAQGHFISPAFIDGHVHIESSMVAPSEFAKVLLPHGVTTVIADPHEIANVLGNSGILFMLDSSENLPLNFYFMLPSCVPAADFEHSGATLTHEDLEPFYAHPRVLGLAEVMNFPAVLNAEADMMAKIMEAKQNRKKIDGHAAGLSASDINVYMSAGIRTDHESTTSEQAKERLQRGMYLMIREGTVAKDLEQLIPIVNERNARRCLFVTDDKHLDDLVRDGSIDYNVRLAVQSGLSPVTAIQMATINAAECFGLDELGAIAPGYKADFLMIDDLETINITAVFKDGVQVVKEGILFSPENEAEGNEPSPSLNSVNFHPLTENQFHIPISSNEANIIEIIPNSLVTNHIIAKVDIDGGGLFQPSTAADQLKIAVIERHHMKRHIGLGIVKGLGLKSGAIATTIAHDSHNLVVAGTNDVDMVMAVNKLREIKGGLIVVNEGKILASLELPIAGLMSLKPYTEVIAKLEDIHLALKNLGVSEQFNPFLTLSFLTLPVIPELKLTVQGLFQVSKFNHIPIDAAGVYSK
ncbi:adenine deaminase [Peribacillus sp. SCS-155]|uniref:adenine deaminase n=1 Tax=Peribacillus sedimenti TaxID=3115297 RepID=UPI00390686AF